MSYRIYGEDAPWFDLLTTPADYAEEAEVYRGAFAEFASGAITDVLELGAGAGNNAAHLKRDWSLSLVDLSPEMLALSRRYNPECTHVVGDMRSIRLGRTFDAVFVHDAVTYMTSIEDLEALARTAFVHCRPGAALVLVPKFLRETFRPVTRHGGHDASAGEDGSGAGRSLRWLHWCSDPDPDDTTYRVLLTYVLREADGSYRTETEEHINGLFPRKSWHAVLTAAGFAPPVFRPTDTSVPILTHRPERQP